jgi:hypothetical protein
MTCTPNQFHRPRFESSNFVAGNNNVPGPVTCDCQNNPANSNFPLHGPLPPGDYTIGPQKQGSSRRNLPPDSGNLMSGRSSFQIHGCGNPSTCSEGCISSTTNKTRDRLNELLHLEEGSNRLHVTY